MLNESLSGADDAARDWFARVRQTPVDFGFERLQFERDVFELMHEGKMACMRRLTCKGIANTAGTRLGS